MFMDFKDECWLFGWVVLFILMVYGIIRLELVGDYRVVIIGWVCSLFWLNDECIIMLVWEGFMYVFGSYMWGVGYGVKDFVLGVILINCLWWFDDIDMIFVCLEGWNVIKMG